MSIVVIVQIVTMLSTTPFLFDDTPSEEDSGYRSNSFDINSSSHCSSITSTSHHRISSSFRTPNSFSDSLFSCSRNDSSKDINFNDGLCTSFRYCQRPSLLGREFVDFMYYFGEKTDYRTLLQKILGYLSIDDLLNIAHVSKCWKSVIMSTLSLEKKMKIKTHLKRLKILKENASPHGYARKNVISLQNPRITLIGIENLNLASTSSVSSDSPSPCLPVFEVYQREGQKLEPGKRLYSCPKCRFPSRVDENVPDTAQCMDCQYRFCCICECVVHPEKKCDFITTPVVRKYSNIICSKQSKKNLKRLRL